jgi:DNA polymerase I-like protein with 3'-5' exonuclease and polymerase domains
VQIGDAQEGWAIPWEGWGAVALDALSRYEGPLVAHNLAFDARWLEHHAPEWNRWKAPWHRLHDTMIMAHMVDSSQSIGLKELSTRLIDPNAAAGEQHLKTTMHNAKWDWNTIPIKHETYWLYSSLDVVLTAQLYEIFQKKITENNWTHAYETEMAVRRVCSKMEDNGCPVDLNYINRKNDELDEDVRRIKDWGKENYGINLASAQQLVKVLQEQGAVFTRQTPSGAPSVDKEQLQILALEFPLAQQVLEMRKSEKLSTTYLRNLLDKEIDGIIHPSIKTVGARSGRMCVPDSHQLLTKDGLKNVKDILVGDETLDESGNWTTVREVYQYQDQPTVTLSWPGLTLECTKEHRWLTYDMLGNHQIGVLLPNDNRMLQLTPDPGLNVLFPRMWLPRKKRLFYAFLVGALASQRGDLEMTFSGDIVGYLTDLDEQVSEYLANSAPFNLTWQSEQYFLDDGYHYSVKADWEKIQSWLWKRELFIQAGYSIKNTKLLVPWILNAKRTEAREFLDGYLHTCRDGDTIPDPSSPLATALRIAAYRTGYRLDITVNPPVKLSGRVDLTEMIATSSFPPYNNDVWCVRTDTGTMTAWSQDGPYLTGNSITDPALQTLPKNDTAIRNAFIPREGHKILASDYDQVELRLMAYFSGDKKLKEDFSGGDFFVNLAKDIYQDQSFSKSDPRRGIVKAAVYAMLYGGGAPKISTMLRRPEQEIAAILNGFHTSYPRIKRFMNEVSQRVESRLNEEGMAYVDLPHGRRLMCDEEKIYAAVNMIIQGTAALVFKDALVRLDNQGYGDYLLVPVHDEVVLSIPESEIKDAIVEIPRILQPIYDPRGQEYPVPLTADSSGPLDRWGAKT